MTAQERQMLVDLFERIRATGGAPRDPQAESFIADAVRAVPFAPYVMAQTVLVQQQGLEAANRRIQELEAQLQGSAPQGETSFLGGLGKALFGAPAAPAGATPPPYRPAPQAQPQYAPQYAPAPAAGPWGAAPAGGGFLSGALRTAAGVAGGIAVADMLGGLLGGHGGYGGGLFGNSGFGGGEVVHETVNNFYGAPDPGAGTSDAGWNDPSGGQDFSQDAGFPDDGGFDDGSSGGGFDV